MVDREVETALREIRERVRAEVGVQAATRAAAARPEGFGAEAPPPTPGGAAPEALARLEANLATAARAWDRLPPLVSNRRGWPARVELWVKRLLKRATHWYTWEQVNFNAAALHSLRDVLAALSAHERRLEELRDALRRSGEEMDERLASLDARLNARLDARLDAEGELRGELRGEVANDIERLRGEQEERAAHLLEELRVCFRQLSLEAGEAAVAADRARRQTEARLAELERMKKSDE